MRDIEHILPIISMMNKKMCSSIFNGYKITAQSLTCRLESHHSYKPCPPSTIPGPPTAYKVLLYHRRNQMFQCCTLGMSAAIMYIIIGLYDLNCRWISKSIVWCDNYKGYYWTTGPFMTINTNSKFYNKSQLVCPLMVCSVFQCNMKWNLLEIFKVKMTPFVLT